jgi:hypothetical protein
VSGGDWVYAAYTVVMGGLIIGMVVMIVQVIRDWRRDRVRRRP